MKSFGAFIALLLIGAILSASGIAPAIVPAQVPTANKRGTSNVFALASSNSAGSAGATYCDDGSGNLTTSGCAAPGPQGNCSSAASPAVCGAAGAGSVVVAAAATTVVVNTSAVTANSQILLMYDGSLGTKLSVTCNTTIPALYGVSARTAGASFTLSATAPITNPACFSYVVLN